MQKGAKEKGAVYFGIKGSEFGTEGRRFGKNGGGEALKKGGALKTESMEKAFFVRMTSQQAQALRRLIWQLAESAHESGMEASGGSDCLADADSDQKNQEDTPGVKEPQQARLGESSAACVEAEPFNLEDLACLEEFLKQVELMGFATW